MDEQVTTSLGDPGVWFCLVIEINPRALYMLCEDSYPNLSVWMDKRKALLHTQSFPLKVSFPPSFRITPSFLKTQTVHFDDRVRIHTVSFVGQHYEIHSVEN